MRSIVICIVICMLGACAGVPQRQGPAESACVDNEASYACQVERYKATSA